jgi:putative glutamine amidotransferase
MIKSTRPLIGLPVQSSSNALRYEILVAYCEAVVLSGGAPALLPLLPEGEALRTLYEREDGLCLVGGGDVAPERYGATRPDLCAGIDPPRDATEIALCRWALDEGKPTLAICRGVQVLNVAAGGTLYEDIATCLPGALMHATSRDHPLDYVAHTVAVEPDSRLGEWLALDADAAQHVPVNSWHHQALRKVAPGLRTTAVAPDGVIEAVEAGAGGRAHVVGVQWHPERMMPGDQRMMRLFTGFCRLCAESGGRR